ncbi:MAG: glycosyltransferase family 4 protein [Muribaculaceae bacterium]|nr:glycosyltransferase family 4 protein [Muribaculaceae bacterium]
MRSIKFLYPRVVIPVTGGHRYEKSLRDTLARSGFTVETLSTYNTTGRLPKIKKLLAPLLSLKFLKTLDKQNDIVVLNSTTGLYYILLSFILKLKRIPTVIIHHHYLYKEFKGFKQKVYHCVENLFLKSAANILTPSPYIKDLINQEINRDSLLLPIPFERLVIGQERSVEKGRLLYIGTIEPRKGLDLLITALNLTEKPQDYELHIVGKTRMPEYKKYIDSLINDYQLNVIFHGFLSDEDLNELIQTSDVFVFPSLLEGFGMAINEVKFYGLPVICFNNSAMPYSTTDGYDGFLVKNKDIEGFAKAIDKLVQDRTTRASMSHNAIVKANALYSFENFNNDSVSLFSNIGK